MKLYVTPIGNGRVSRNFVQWSSS